LEPTSPSIDLADPSRRPIPGYQEPVFPKDRYWLHLVLFALTLVSTVLAGGQLAGRFLAYPVARPDAMSSWLLDRAFLLDGLRFGGSLLLFLTVHEFGHYFAARSYRINASLPYYIPTYLFGLGTLGAVIRIREPIPHSRALFDIGVAGPLAGFVTALAVLVYAFATLPAPEYVMDLPGHEALKAYVDQHGAYPPDRLVLPAPPPEEGSITLIVGQTPLFWLLSLAFDHVPPMDELYHFPILFAGWMGLFFTALNLLPVGQLDGGHILYTLIGPRWHGRVARLFVLLLLLSGSLGFMDEVAPWLGTVLPLLDGAGWFVLAGILYFFLRNVFKNDHRYVAPALLGIVVLVVLLRSTVPDVGSYGYTSWFIWCLLIVMFIRIEHPPVLRSQPLTPLRRVLAILSVVIFLLCFSFTPLRVV
jgi:membrane-associated protease RseP (regulator of RpoE activity)